MANSEYLSLAITALTRFHEAVGDNVKFSFDQIWEYLTAEESIVPSGNRPALAKPLVAQGYIKPTGMMRNAATQARAGRRGTEYVFGSHFIGAEVTSRLTAGMERAKPFLILAGPSGTGKSRWVREQAFQTWAATEKQIPPSNYLLIPVKPNWHDSSDLLGYVTRLGLKEGRKARFVVTEFVKFVVRSWKTPHSPHWLCLDEMNLAPVEQYFAEYLSVIETRRTGPVVYGADGANPVGKRKGRIETDPIIPATVFGDLLEGSDTDPLEWLDFCRDAGLDLTNKADQDLSKNFRKNGISLPGNLIVVGTVNMDETTHSFSRKVLDRAFVWEMPIGDLGVSWKSLGYPSDPAREWEPFLATDGGDAKLILEATSQEFPTAWLDTTNSSTAIVRWLMKVNGALDSTPFQVSYRVRDELLLLAAARGVSSIDDLHRILDDGLYSKILPRIEGDEVRTRRALTRLAILLSQDADLAEAEGWPELVDELKGSELPLEKLRSAQSGPAFMFGFDSWPADPFAPAFPWRRSLNKIRSMLLKLEGQFTSYWD